ncbi:hypothetical protein SAMN05216337_101811 [Bradyrhizobium brasilense]|uniref:Uncharacterized protein n=1 Tax=Bradyrhizobium brasilense TaxID=1419277 RepID=A0A1G6Z9F1_9BRAD|nr:hypothetical protein SAMN05216337_101811 [Bradyrhizobium brasilense]
MNGFSNWPEELPCGQVTVVLAGEVLRRAGRRTGLSDFTAQDLRGLVIGFNRWPQESAARQATIAIVNEVLGRGVRFFDFTKPESESLLDDFSRWPQGATGHEAIAKIIGELQLIQSEATQPRTGEKWSNQTRQSTKEISS